MSHRIKILAALSRLLNYPGEETIESAEFLYVAFKGEIDSAAKAASEFGQFLQENEPWQVEESYTRTFDINPACALEVGWHLFGEEYQRGLFLVRMREELRKYDLPESSELPDHLVHVLAVIAHMPEEESAKFVLACVLPAVEKMNQSLDGKAMPYQSVLIALEAYLKHVWNETLAKKYLKAQSDDKPKLSGETDLLRSYPVADVAPQGAGYGSSNLEFVPLQIQYPSPTESTRKP